MMLIDAIPPSFEQAERWARVVLALAGALAATVALVRRPLAMLLRAAALAAVRALLRDADARAALVRIVREQQRAGAPDEPAT